MYMYGTPVVLLQCMAPLWCCYNVWHPCGVATMYGTPVVLLQCMAPVWCCYNVRVHTSTNVCMFGARLQLAVETVRMLTHEELV